VAFAGEAPALEIPGVSVRAHQGSMLELAFDPALIAVPALIARIAAAHPVEDIHVEEPPIEEVVARFYALHGAEEG
jgi:ABC-2 type transport system ATP-binding protein